MRTIVIIATAIGAAILGATALVSFGMQAQNHLAFAVPSGSYNSTDFEITNMSLIDEPSSAFGYLAIVGFVKNIGNETYDAVNLVVTLYDKNNTLIDVAEGYPSMADVAVPGGMAPFKIALSTPPAKLHHYVVEVGAIDFPKSLDAHEQYNRSLIG